MNWKLALIVTLAAASSGYPIASATAAEAPTSPFSSAKFTQTITTTRELSYLISLPEGYNASQEKKWPLILFLHGAGERGTNLQAVAVHGIPKHLNAGQKIPFVVVAPQCPNGEIWDDATLLGLLDKLIATHQIDSKRVYLTGLSMGGYGSWSLGTRHPERFAAIAPVCGGGERLRLLLLSESQKKSLKTLGIWAFHGGKDDVVPLEESERMIAAVKKAGNAAPKLTVYPNDGHDSWNHAYAEAELLPWFLKHSR